MNQYHIYEAIGRGKHSTVYKGRKKKSIEYYAIKSVEKSQKNKVLQEVRTLHSLDHSNVLKFYAWYETSAHLWLILEYCVGGDLLTLLKQDTRLPIESVHDFARDLVQALQFLHSKGVIYCDLKPSNVLLDENGRLKLCDFGLARRLSDISKNTLQQLPQAKRGTPCYMAPELFQGGVHSFASDIWALGCVMYECYAGKPPFVSSSFTQLVDSILHDAVPALWGSPNKEFADLLSRLLVKDPAERIKWAELRDHSFWRTKPKALPLPSQPAFMKYLEASKKSESTATENGVERIRNGEGSAQKQQHLGSKRTDHIQHKFADVTKGSDNTGRPNSGSRRPGPLKEVTGRANSAVNLLRLSKIVKTNLQREAEGESYRQLVSNPAPSDTDLTLENNDQELDFAERTDNDAENEDEDGATVVPSAGTTTPATPATPVACEQQHRDTISNHHQEDHLTDDATCDSNGKEFEFDRNTERLEALRLEVAATPPGVGIPRKAQRVAVLAGEKKKVSSAAAVHRNDDVAAPPKASITLSQALWHPSDLAVRPIMQNRKADKLEAAFDVRALPIDALASSEFLKLPQEQLEVFIGRIMSSITGNTSANEKINTLKYLETLCVTMDAANLLINGALMPSLVKLLRTTKLPALRIQLTSVIGILIRHATIIEDDLASSGIVAVLTDTLRDKQEKVRRCAMASLGELLFFIATQSGSSPRSATGNTHDNPSSKEGKSAVWQVPSTTIALVAAILRKGEDDVTQHYALRAMENVSSQGGEWATRFTSQDVLSNLCYMLKSSAKPEAFRATAGSCLVRLLRFSPSSVSVLLDKMNFRELVGGLAKGSSKLQQVYVNLVNIALVGSSVMNNMNKLLIGLFEEKALVPSIMSMLEQSPEVLRGKSFVSAALLCKINRRWLPSLCNAKLLPAVERLTKEKDPYVQQCVEALVQIIVSLVPGILESISSDLNNLSAGKRPNSVASHFPGSTAKTQPRNSLPLFPVVLHLFKSTTFRDRIVDEHILQQLAAFMKRLESSLCQAQEEFESTLLRIVEVISQQSLVVLGNEGIFASEILPSLTVLYKKNTSGDARFLCLKIFCDIIVVITDDIAASPEENESEEMRKRRDQMKIIIRHYFLPLYPVLLDDEDPIPMYAQKLLVMLLDLRFVEVVDMLKLKLVSHFFDFLREDFSTVNLHSVRLCLYLVSSHQVATGVLSGLRISNRLVTLLEFVYGKGMEDFLEPVLSVCRTVLLRNAGKHGSGGSGSTSGGSGSTSGGSSNGFSREEIEDVEEFGKWAGVFLELCGHHGPRIAEAASECLVLAVKASPMFGSTAVLSRMGEVARVLQDSTKAHSSALLSLLQRRLLQALTISCKHFRAGRSSSPHAPTPLTPPSLASGSSSGCPAALPVSAGVMSGVESVVLRLRKSNLPQVADAAIDAALELQLLST